MKEIELPLDAIRWPECCCSCGSRTFAWTKHTEKVVLWTVLTVTKYRVVTLEIPVCSRCTLRSWWWYGGAAALCGLTYLALSIAESHHHEAGAGFALPLVAAIAMAIKGTRTSPLRILKIDPDQGRVIVKIHDDKVALAVARKSGGHESFVEQSRMRRLLAIGGALLGATVLLVLVLGHLSR